MKRFTIKEGKHPACPSIFNFMYRPGCLSWEVRFTESCRYNHFDQDQKDWNKLCGIGFLGFLKHPSHWNSAMIGWRYSPNFEAWEVNAYYHLNNSRSFTDPLMVVQVMESLQVDLIIDYRRKDYRFILISGDQIMEHRQPFSHRSSFTREINTWFGGQKSAPHEIHLLKQTLPRC